MATGRTVSRWARYYMNGYDLSGDVRQIGALSHMQDEDEQTGISANVRGYLPNHQQIGVGSLNAIFNMDGTDEIHDLFNAPSGNYPIMIPIGIRAAPAAGDPVFIAQLNEISYTLDADNGTITVNIAPGMRPTTTSMTHTKPWGVMLKASGAVTAANTSTGIDDNGASSAYGGLMCYQVFAGNGTATLKVQHAATNENGSFADLTGATSGVIDCSTPKAGIVQTATDTTVNRYLRWQIALGTATTEK